MKGSLTLFRRELGLAWAGGSGLFLPAAFFAGTIFLGPLGIGTEPKLLSAIAPGMIFVALCLASITTLERIFQADLEVGATDHHRLSGATMELVTLYKVLAHWLVSGLPLALLTPVAGVMMRAETVTAMSILPVLVGGLTIFLWGGIGAGGMIATIKIISYAVPQAALAQACAAADLWSRSSSCRYLSQLSYSGQKSYHTFSLASLSGQGSHFCAPTVWRRWLWHHLPWQRP